MNLRNQILRGGTYLVLRQGLGQVVNLGGMLLLSRMIGPEAYGLYAGALGIFTYLFNLSQWGIGVYVIRREGEVRAEVYHQAFTLLLLLGSVGSLVSILALPLLARWVRLEGFSAIALGLFLGLPVKLLTLVPSAGLERALDYRKVAVVELAGQTAYYLVALALAWGGLGAWSPVGGWWIQQSLALIWLHKVARYRPRLCWNPSLVREILGYGVGFSASIWVWQLRELVNPLVVGRYVGVEAVGYVALAARMVNGLSFVSVATWRLSMAALARMQNDLARLVRAITEGMRLQVLALGPMLVGFGWIAPRLLPLFAGSRWLPVTEVFPFVALGYLTNGAFNLHASALYVLKSNWEITAFHLVHVCLFAGAAFLLVPRIGLLGYGWAEVAALLSYAVLHACTVRRIGAPDYRVAAVWWAGFGLSLFWQELGWWTALALVVILLWPETWRELQGYARSFRAMTQRG